MISALHFGTSHKPLAKRQPTSESSPAQPNIEITVLNSGADPQDIFESRTGKLVSFSQLTQTGGKLVREFNRAQTRLAQGESVENEDLLKAVQEFVEYEGNLNNTKIDGATMLQMAVANGCPKSTQIFLNNGADINAQEDGTGKTSKDLLEEQEKLTPSNHPNRPALQETRQVLEKHEQAMQNLSKAREASDARILAGQPGETEASVRAIRQLVEQGFNVNAPLSSNMHTTGGSLAHYVIGRTWPKSFSYLLKQGLNLTVTDNFGNTPLEMLKLLKGQKPQKAAIEEMKKILEVPIKYQEIITQLNNHLPDSEDAITAEPEQSLNWLHSLLLLTGVDALKQPGGFPELNRSGSLYEIVALAGWPKATDFLLNCGADPKQKTKSGKSIAGLVGKKLAQHKDNVALQETRNTISIATQKNAELAKAKAQMEVSLQRIEKGEPSESDELLTAVQNYIKILNGADSFIDRKRTFLHVAAEHGWPRTAKMLMDMELDPRTQTAEEPGRTAFQIVEESIEKTKKLPESPAKARRLQELSDTREVIFKDKKIWDATTELENAERELYEQRELGKYGDTSGSEKAIQSFIAAGGDVNKTNRKLGGSVMHLAALYGLVNSIPAILKAGGNLHSTDPDKMTPLAINKELKAQLQIQLEETKTKLQRQRTAAKDHAEIIRRFPGQILVTQDSEVYKNHQLLKAALAKTEAVEKLLLQEQAKLQEVKIPQELNDDWMNTPPSPPPVPKSTRPKPQPSPHRAKNNPKKKNITPAPPPVYDPEAAARQSEEALRKKREKELARKEQKEKQRATQTGGSKKTKPTPKDQAGSTTPPQPTQPNTKQATDASNASSGVNPFVLRPIRISKAREEELDALMAQDSRRFFKMLPTALESEADYDPIQTPTYFFSKALARIKASSAPNDESPKTEYAAPTQPSRADIEEILGVPENETVETFIPKFWQRHSFDTKIRDEDNVSAKHPSLKDQLLKNLHEAEAAEEQEALPEWA